MEAWIEASTHAGRTLAIVLVQGAVVGLVVFSLGQEASGRLEALAVLEIETPRVIPVVAEEQLDVDALGSLSGVEAFGFVRESSRARPVAASIGPVVLHERSFPLVTVERRALDALSLMGPRITTAMLASDRVALVPQSARATLDLSDEVLNAGLWIDGARYDAIAVTVDSSTPSAVRASIMIVVEELPPVRAAQETDTLLVRPQSGAAYAVASALPYVLAPSRPESVSVLIPPQPESIRELLEVSLSRSGSLLITGLFSGVAVVVAVLGWITNLQRRKEHGLRRALGSSKQDLFLLVVLESGTLSVLGATVGAAAGVIASLVVDLIGDRVGIVNPIAVGAAIAVSGAIGTIAGVIPALLAARTLPAVALRSEA